MARFNLSSSDAESQIDPFNAGEPIMPWDEPETLHEEECALDEAPYDAPSPDRTAQQRAREQKRAAEEARRASKQRKPSDRGESREESGRSTGPLDDADQPAGPGRQAGAPLTRGRRILVVVLAFLMLLAVFSMISRVVIASRLTSSNELVDEIVNELEEDGDIEQDEDYDYSLEDDEDEAWCRAAVEERLDALGSDEAARQILIESFSDYVFGCCYYTPEELGLDTEGFADWYFSNFWYETDSVYCFEDDGNGSVFFYAMGADYDALGSFTDALVDYLSEAGIWGGEDALTNEQVADIQALYEDFLSSWDASDENACYCYVEFSYEDGAWVLDEDSYEAEIEWILGL